MPPSEDQEGRARILVIGHTRTYRNAREDDEGGWDERKVFIGTLAAISAYPIVHGTPRLYIRVNPEGGKRGPRN